MLTFLRDVRFGLRILTRHPSFGIAAVTVIALGIGATTAVFSVIRGVLLQPLPYPEPDRLVLFRVDAPGFVHQPLLTSEEFFMLRERTDLFDQIATASNSEGNLTDGGDMEAVTAAFVSDNFLATLGVVPALGRAVSARRDIGAQWVRGINISYELWQRRWRGDPRMVGRDIDVNNLPMTVVGILPRGFRIYLGPGTNVPMQADIWFPGAPDDVPTYRGCAVVARLRRGVTPAAAQAAVDGLVNGLVASHAAHYRTGQVRMTLTTLDKDVVSGVKPALVALAGAVGFVLLVACANLTNLLLARTCARTREIAVRTAIGASRGQLVRQLAAESLALGVLGAAAGLLIAQWGVDGLLRLAPAALPRREAITINGAVASFAVAVSLLASLIVGLVPAWQATKAGVSGMLKQDPAGTRGAGTTRGMLVASQLALSLVLLVGAGLLIRAFVSMRAVPLGFDPSRALTMNVRLHVSAFDDPAKRLAFYQAVASAARQIAGAQQVGVGYPVPLSGDTVIQRIAAGPGNRNARPQRRSRRRATSKYCVCRFSRAGTSLLLTTDGPRRS